MKKLIAVIALAATLTACGRPDIVANETLNPVQSIELDGYGTKNFVVERYCDGTTGIMVAKSGFTGTIGGITETPNAPYCTGQSQ